MSKAGRILPRDSSAPTILNQGLDTEHLSGGERIRYRGNCRNIDPDLFTPPPELKPQTRQAFMNAAKLVCLEKCPVLPDCMEYGLNNEQEPGVWGGLDEAGRKALSDETEEYDIGRMAVLWSNSS